MDQELTVDKRAVNHNADTTIQYSQTHTIYALQSPRRHAFELWGAFSLITVQQGKFKCTAWLKKNTCLSLKQYIYNIREVAPGVGMLTNWLLFVKCHVTMSHGSWGRGASSSCHKCQQKFSLMASHLCTNCSERDDIPDTSMALCKRKTSNRCQRNLLDASFAQLTEWGRSTQQC